MSDSRSELAEIMRKLVTFSVIVAVLIVFSVQSADETVATAKGKSKAPAITFSTLFGASDREFGIEVATDSAGAIIVVGSTGSTDFPILNPIPGGHVNKGGTARYLLPEGQDAYVAKFDKRGDLVFSTYLGGTDGELALGIATDAKRNIYVTGYTASTDFPVLNAVQPTNAGDEDAFVTKFDKDGNLVFSTYLGGSTQDRAQGIAVDREGNVYVHGQASSVDYPTVNAFQSVHAGGYIDSTLTILSPDGSEMLASTIPGWKGWSSPSITG